MRNITLSKSLLLLAVWMGFTVGLAAFISSRNYAPLTDAVGRNVGPSWALALVLLIVVAWRTDRPAIGLQAPVTGRSLRLLWLPIVYLCLMGALTAATGAPPARIALMVAVNTFMVGMSEELMFRGFLFRGLLARCRVWPAVLLSSLAFGVVHVFNGLMTGQWIDAGIQATAAFMLAIGFIAIRIRTESLYPMMIVHGLWDCLLMWQMLSPKAAPAEALPGYSIAAILIAVPMFVYGLFLMRHLQRDYGHWSAA